MCNGMCNCYEMQDVVLCFILWFGSESIYLKSYYALLKKMISG